jgi:integrase
VRGCPALRIEVSSTSSKTGVSHEHGYTRVTTGMIAYQNKAVIYDLLFKAAAEKQAPGLGQRELEEIVDTLDVKADRRGATTIDARDRALLLVASDTLARASELVELRWRDIEAAEDGAGTIVIRRSKIDQEGEGRVAWLSPEAMGVFRGLAPRAPRLPEATPRRGQARPGAAPRGRHPLLPLRASAQRDP